MTDNETVNKQCLHFSVGQHFERRVTPSRAQTTREHFHLKFNADGQMDVTWGSGNQHLLSSTSSGASKSATKVLLIASIEKT